MVDKVLSRPDTWLVGSCAEWPSDEPFSYRRDRSLHAHKRHLDVLRGDTFSVNTAHIWALLRCGVLRTTPQIHESEIDKTARSDTMTKFFVVGHIVALALRSCLRMNAKLPVCPLEYASLAYAFCSAITYGLCWDKPQGIKTPFVIHIHEKLPEGLFTEPASLADWQHGADIPFWVPFDENLTINLAF